MMKNRFEFEPYLDFIKEDKFRTALTRFKVSSHQLAIETGRYNNIERNERKCLNCNMNVVESEYHFILVCPKFIEIRKQYLKKYYYQWPTIQKFENLFSNKSKLVILNISKYIYNALQLRT